MNTQNRLKGFGASSVHSTCISSFISYNNPRWYSYSPHFADRENEAQLGQHHTAREWQSWAEPRPSQSLSPSPFILFWEERKVAAGEG